MRKLIAFLLAGVLAFSLIGCGSSEKSTSDSSANGPNSDNSNEQDHSNTESNKTGTAIAPEDLKVGLIFIGDENEGYTAAHYHDAKDMAKNLGLSEDQLKIKWNVPEDETCYDAAVDLADSGCQIIFANSFGHEDYMLQAAQEFPDVQFCHSTGYQAASSGLSNMHNYFTSVYESRYVSGVVAGMKLNEMLESGTINNAKIGYVGAYPYAEVISGFTAFYLGAKSVCESVTMEVTYVNSWGSFDLEKEAAEALIADGCALISQHSDTTGPATACEAAGVPVVGYSISMIEVAPTQALTSSAINWTPYMTYAAQSVINGVPFDVDWCKGYSEGADSITELNESAVAKGTEEKVKEVENAIKDGSLKVFDTSTFTVDGQTVDSFTDDFGQEYISDGYFHESEYASAPSFNLMIDGITTK